MANEEQLSILKQGVEVWNKWRENNQDVYIDLKQAELMGADLVDVYLYRADLRQADLSGANLIEADFWRADLSEANLSHTDLKKANLRKADLSNANLSEADLREANLSEATLIKANLNKVDLSDADLTEANLMLANLSEATINKANLNGASLSGANLSKANLTGAYLMGTILVNTKIDQAKISGSSIYAVNVWDLEGEFVEQKDLVITPPLAPIITVDNIKVAQFIYLILNNEEIRDVINTLTSKSVLILGRFSIPERKAILDALRNKLREYDLLPIVFDFDRPTDKDFTETIKTLAGLCYFVIADVTNPKSSPLELQATVPDYQIPFVPIIQEGENPFAMMVDLQKKYNWVLNTVTYDSADTLMKILKPLIIDPAMKKRQELRLIKAQEPEVISGKDYLEKGKA